MPGGPAFRGPPPLTRGYRGLGAREGEPERSTPAYAGLPPTRPSTSTPTRVHPRLRGATVRPSWRVKGISGPPPLTRGYRRRDRPRLPAEGSTPAYAGLPAPEPGPSRPPRVHPRLRGATGTRAGAIATAAGPPPLTRGYHALDRLRAAEQRSTPAYAGLPPGAVSGKASARVHPRLRGATGSTSAVRVLTHGPPPLTRGYPAAMKRISERTGSTPAYAGLPGASTSLTGPAAVHPRLRGATGRRTRR